MSLNITVLQGRLTKDPKLMYTKNGKAYSRGSMAVNGFTKEEVNFIDFICWEKQAEFINKYFKKGSEIIISGFLKQERWQKEGQNFSKLIVNIVKSEFCGSNNQQNNGQQNASKVNDVFNKINDKVNELDNACNDPWQDQTSYNDDDMPF